MAHLLSGLNKLKRSGLREPDVDSHVDILQVLADSYLVNQVIPAKLLILDMGMVVTCGGGLFLMDLDGLTLFPIAWTIGTIDGGQRFCPPLTLCAFLSLSWRIPVYCLQSFHLAAGAKDPLVAALPVSSELRRGGSGGTAGVGASAVLFSRSAACATRRGFC